MINELKFCFTKAMAVLVVLFLSAAGAQNGPLDSIKPIGKVPKSLFLIKKAKIDNDVGDPVLYPKYKQEQSLRNEKIYRKYNLSESFKEL